MIKFQDLPVEICLEIWELVDQRVVTIDHTRHPDKFNIGQRSLFVQESYPVSLAVCRDSRQLGLARYPTYFLEPTPPWSYTGIPHCPPLDVICEQVGVPEWRHLPVRKSPEQLAFLEEITTYVNHRKAKESVILKKKNRPIRWKFSPLPRWFDPKTDTLLVKSLEYTRIKNKSFSYKPGFRDLLWQPNWSSEASTLRHLTLCIPFGYLHPLPSFIGVLQVEKWKLPQLQNIDFLCLEDREIATIAMDNSGLLKGPSFEDGDWACSLAASAEDRGKYEAQKGFRELRVEWSVVIKKEDRMSLTQLVAEWKLDFEVWEAHKEEILEGQYLIPYQNPLPASFPQKVLLENGDGKTYL